MEARQMTPFFSSAFSAMFVTFICEFESTQFLPQFLAKSY